MPSLIDRLLQSEPDPMNMGDQLGYAELITHVLHSQGVSYADRVLIFICALAFESVVSRKAGGQTTEVDKELADSVHKCFMEKMRTIRLALGDTKGEG